MYYISPFLDQMSHLPVLVLYDFSRSWFLHVVTWLVIMTLHLVIDLLHHQLSSQGLQPRVVGWWYLQFFSIHFLSHLFPMPVALIGQQVVTKSTFEQSLIHNFAAKKDSKIFHFVKEFTDTISTTKAVARPSYSINTSTLFFLEATSIYQTCQTYQSLTITKIPFNLVYKMYKM